MVVLEHVKIVCSPRECEYNVLEFNLMYVHVLDIVSLCVCVYLYSVLKLLRTTLMKSGRPLKTMW